MRPAEELLLLCSPQELLFSAPQEQLPNGNVSKGGSCFAARRHRANHWVLLAPLEFVGIGQEPSGIWIDQMNPAARRARQRLIAICLNGTLVHLGMALDVHARYRAAIVECSLHGHI